MIEDDDNEVRFFQHPSLALGGGFVVLLIAVAICHRAFIASSEAPQKQLVINVVPPSPEKPQPTPIPAATPTPPQIVEKPDTTFIPAGAPASAAPRVPVPPAAPGPISTNINVQGGPTDLVFGGPGNGGDGPGDQSPGGPDGQFGAFANEVQTRVLQALQSNPRTRLAAMKLTVRIWPDASGRVIRARIAPGTGNHSLDNLIQNQILTGLQLASVPPAGMRLPIVMSVTAERPE